jgi:hypothetical protein
MANAFAHIELTTSDLGAAKKFYKKLFAQLGPQVVTYGPARDRKRACRTACSVNGPTTAYTPIAP